MRYSLPLIETLPSRTIARVGMDKKASLREITERVLLKHYGAIAVLVNERGDILYLHGHAGQYLEPLIGEQVVNNILKINET